MTRSSLFRSIYCVILFMCYMNSVHCIYLMLPAIGLNKKFLILIIENLYHYGIRDTVNKWICSYLMNRYQYVTINGTTSDYMIVLCGVPQGSILGPILFILYINDMCNVSTLLKPILVISHHTHNGYQCCTCSRNFAISYPLYNE